jgi:hypothetical protein
VLKVQDESDKRRSVREEEERRDPTESALELELTTLEVPFDRMLD